MTASSRASRPCARFCAQHYVHRNEANLVRSNIREQGRHKVIDKISVDLNDKTDAYEATFANLASITCWSTPTR